MAQRITDLVKHQSGSTSAQVEFDKADVEGTLTARFKKMVDLHPSRIAVKEGEVTYTYRELNAAANRLAHTLISARGDGPGRVGLLFETSAGAVIGHLGALKAGKTYFALDPNFPIARLNAIYEDADTDVVVTTQAHLDLASELGGQLIISLDDLEPGVADDDPDIEINPDTLAAIVYTSGSTGRPKGVMQTHRVLLHRVWADTHYSKITINDRQSMLLSLTFGAGFPDVLDALLNGASLYPFNLRKHDLLQLANWLEQEEITIFTPPVAAFRQFHKVCPPEKRFSDCRLVILAGEASYREEVEAFRRLFDGDRCELINLLAASEAQIFCRYRITADTPLPERVTPVGYADPDKEIRILDADGRRVADGETGEMLIRSPYLSHGYWRRPELTQAAFESHDDGTISYRTNDLARVGADGCIEHLGRLDYVIKLRGYRIELVEVEGVLVGMGAVRAAAVTSREVNPGQPQLLAYVVLEPGAAITATEVRQTVGEHLPDYMIPARVTFVEDLPRTTNGKVDRRALRELPIDLDRQVSEHAAPRQQKLQTTAITLSSELERRFTEIWREVLGVNDIGVNDDFFELGGDSLSMVRLATELRLVTGREFPIQNLLHAPTIAGLVALVQDGKTPISLVELSPAEGRALERRPLFCVLGLYLYKHLADALGCEVTTYGIFVEAEAEFLKPEQIASHKFLPQRSPLLQMPGTERLASVYIEEIRKVQPAGPYQLMGSSFGGVVAFEIARQLEAAGEKVRLLAMLDSFAPGFRKPASLRGWASYARRQLMRFVPRRMPTHSSSPQDWDQLRVRARAEAERKYRPGSYSGDALLIKAKEAVEFPGYAVDTNLGWDAFVKGQLTVEEVPGDHLGILAPPNVTVLAEKISACLDRDSWQPDANRRPRCPPVAVPAPKKELAV